MYELYQEILRYIVSHQDRFIQAVKMHAAICITVLLVSIVIAVPFGIFCAKKATFAESVMHVFNILKIIPSLAVLIAVMPILGTGFGPALLALSMHAVPTVLVNTYLGFKSVDKSVIESAEGMGLSKREILLKVELPLALPLMITGIRTCSVDVIASATLAAYIGAGGLGEFVVMGIGALNISVMLVGSLSVALLSVIVDFALSFLQRRVTRYQTD
jgi:osmoprotectant transport system permease protein